MLEFTTLLIGLVLGPRQVELAIQEPVAAIEVSLDGHLLHRLGEKPWSLEVDFGDRLIPHRLMATGFDKDGNQLSTAYQIVNYSRSSFEATIILDHDPLEPSRTGKVIWQGAWSEPPQRIELLFDSQELHVDSDGTFHLPGNDPAAVHVLETTVVFAEGSTGVASLTFGGEYSDQTTSSLTAVPVTSARSQPWSKARVRGWLQANGQPVNVFTVTAPTKILVILRDHRLEKATRSVVPWRDRLLVSRFGTSGSTDYLAMAINARPLQNSRGTFRLSRPKSVRPGNGLRRILLHEGSLVPNKSIDGRVLAKTEQKLWDALAVAGLNATRRNTPRLAVLMISNTLADNSQLTPHPGLRWRTDFETRKPSELEDETRQNIHLDKIGA